MMRRRPGFTLLEVLVGLTVAGLALASGMGALALVRDRAEHAEIATVATLEAASFRQMLVDWIAGARVRSTFTTETFQGLDVEYEGQPDDILLFPSTALTHVRAGETVVRLFIDRSDDTPEQGLVAELTTQRGLPPRVVELLPGAAGLQLRYLPESNAGVQEWTEQWTARNQLPRAIEVTIIPAPGVLLPPLLQYPIRVALGTQ